MRIDAIDVYCDPFKAFDCVHHNILVKKLCHYDTAGYGFDCIKSYLSKIGSKESLLMVQGYWGLQCA